MTLQLFAPSAATVSPASMEASMSGLISTIAPRPGHRAGSPPLSHHFVSAPRSAGEGYGEVAQALPLTTMAAPDWNLVACAVGCGFPAPP